MLKSGLSGLMLLAAAGSSAFAQKAVFDFTNVAPGTPTAFTDTDLATGLNATFSSSNDPGGFIIDTIGFVSFSGNALDENQGGPQFGTLKITFSKPVNDLSLNFGLNDQGATGSPFNLLAFNGGVQVGQSTALGQVPANDPNHTHQEGGITYDASAFDSITLSTPVNLFAIDNLSVETVVPEPSTISLWMLGVGCICFGAWRRSRNQVLCPARQENS